MSIFSLKFLPSFFDIPSSFLFLLVLLSFCPSLFLKFPFCLSYFVGSFSPKINFPFCCLSSFLGFFLFYIFFIFVVLFSFLFGPFFILIFSFTLSVFSSLLLVFLSLFCYFFLLLSFFFSFFYVSEDHM